MGKKISVVDFVRALHSLVYDFEEYAYSPENNLREREMTEREWWLYFIKWLREGL